MTRKFLAVALVATLTACGGGGSDGSSGASGGGGGGTGGGGTATSGLTATQYALYQRSTVAQLAGGADTVSNPTANSGTLQLDSGSTTLTITDASTGAMTASNYAIYNRRGGNLIMLCDPSGSKTSRYVGVATAATDGNQAARITNATALAGKTLYYMEDCAYEDTSGKSQGQNSAPDGNTLKMTFDANGNVTTNNGGSFSSSQLNSIISGTAVPVVGANAYYTAYQFGTGSSSTVVIIERGVPTTGSGFVGMWVPAN